MIDWKPKLWAGLGMAALAATGIAGCGGEGEAGAPAAGAAASASAGEAAAGESGGEGAAKAAGEQGGEAGVADAYAAVPEGSRLALRIAHLAGFLLISEKVAATGDAAAASALIQQGLLEVHAPNAADYSGKAAALKPAYEAVMAALDGGKAKADVEAAFANARAAETAALTEAGGDAAAVTTGMLSIATGLYGHVITPQGADPVEYQHAMGAALSAQAVFAAGKDRLPAERAASVREAETALGTLVSAFPAPVAPEAPPPVATILAAAARAELPLSELVAR